MDLSDFPPKSIGNNKGRPTSPFGGWDLIQIVTSQYYTTVPQDSYNNGYKDTKRYKRKIQINEITSECGRSKLS